MERDTPIGKLTFAHGLWLGRHRDATLGADVELLVNGDQSGPKESEVAKIQEFLAEFQENVLALRRKLFMGWSYYPIRIAVSMHACLGVQFQSILPFFRPKLVQDNGTVV